MYACSNQIFITFAISKELCIFLKNGEHSFLSYTKHYLSTKKLAADYDAYLSCG